MVAFMAWFSIPPVMDHIAKDLGIPAAEMYDSNMASVAVTVGMPIVHHPRYIYGLNLWIHHYV